MRSVSRARPSLLLLLLVAVACRRNGDVPSMIEDLEHGDDGRRELAAWDLARVAEHGGDARAALASLARAVTADREPKVRVAALRALSSLGPDAVPAILSASGDTDERVLLAFGKALAQPLPASALPEVTRLLRHKVWQVRESAVSALVKTGPAALPVLAAALRDASTRVVAANALAEMKAVPTLVQAATDPDPELRRVALEALVRIHPAAADILPTYTALLREEALQTTALAGIYALGPDGAPALEPLLAMFGRQPSVSSTVAHIGPAVIPRLIELLAAAPAVAADTARALEELGPAARPAVPALLGRLSGATPAAVRAACLRALARTGLPDEDLAAVVPHLADPDNDVAGAARWVFLAQRATATPVLRSASSGKEPLASRARAVLKEIEEAR